MTKEECIEKAQIEIFGRTYPTLKDGWTFIDELEKKHSGWNNGLQLDRKVVELNEKQIVNAVRPKSLSGIEHNNHWVKIENEYDLPKECASYWVIDKFMKTNPCQHHYTTEGIFSHEMYKRDWLERFTHYQPIIKPEKPIY